MSTVEAAQIQKKSPTHKKKSLSERVYEHLLEKILDGQLVPGETIDRQTIADTLGVSLAPVAQALAQLTAEGLVETLSRKHTRVSLIRREDARGQFALRMALERQAVVMIHGKAVRAEKTRLLSLAEKVDFYPPKHPSAWPAELEFHQALVDLAHCSALSEMYRQVMRRNFFFALHSAHVYLQTNHPPKNQHSLIVEALCTDNPEEADQVLVKHFKMDLAVLKEEIAHNSSVPSNPGDGA